MQCPAGWRVEVNTLRKHCKTLRMRACIDLLEQAVDAGVAVQLLVLLLVLHLRLQLVPVHYLHGAQATSACN